MYNIRVEGLEQSVQKLSNFIKADNVMMAATDTLFWVKDLNLKHLKINQAACDLLYPGSKPDDLTGLTDWEYSEKIGCSKEIIEHIKHGCSVSDNYVLNSNGVSQKFYEKVKSCNGKEYWMLITKEKVPPVEDKEKILGIYGTATYFPFAGEIIKNNYQNVEKLTESIYLIKE